MTVFFIVCTTSVAFFVVFLIACSRPGQRRTTHYKGISVRKISAPPEAQFANASCVRRFFAHLEHQMTEFVATHHPTLAARTWSPERHRDSCEASESSGEA